MDLPVDAILVCCDVAFETLLLTVLRTGVTVLLDVRNRPKCHPVPVAIVPVCWTEKIRPFALQQGPTPPLWLRVPRGVRSSRSPRRTASGFCTGRTPTSTG